MSARRCAGVRRRADGGGAGASRAWDESVDKDEAESVGRGVEAMAPEIPICKKSVRKRS